jgi:hypothetical protein
MPQLLIEDFKAGLDTRRSAFTAPPGSLRELVNAHITRGGEIEKRKAFSQFADATGTVGLHVARDQVHVFGSGPRPMTLPQQVTYVRLQAPDTELDLVEILDSETFNGLVYVIGRFSDGSIYHYYNGARVTDWDALSETLAGNDGVAAFLAQEIGVLAAVTASATGNTVTITAAQAGTPFTYEGRTTNNGSLPDQDVVMTLTQPNLENIPARVSFRVIGGGSGSGNTITSILAGVVELLGAPVAWNTSNLVTMVDIVSAINENDDHEFTAALVDNAVRVTAPVGTGATYNGNALDITSGGSITFEAVSTPAFEFKGGQDEQAQVVTAEIVGTFEPADRYVIVINNAVLATTGLAVGVGTTVKAFGDKLYSTAQSVLFFSGIAGNPLVPDPTWWDAASRVADPDDLPPGFIDMSTKYAGADALTGVGIYQDLLAIFSTRAIELWSVDPDPRLNRRVQTLLSIGSLAPKSIYEYGDQDLFFLSESGLRSLRARDSSNVASTFDPGIFIDSELRDYILNAGGSVIADAVSVVEPTDGRYLLALGDRVYVYTTYPGSRVNAWSRYDLGAPVTEWAVTSRQLYARVGDNLLLYGGDTGMRYDSARVVVDLPYLDGGNPSQDKTMTHLGLGLIGEWSLYLYTEPRKPNHRDYLGTIDGDTYGSIGKYPVAGRSSHFRLRLENESEGPALLANMSIHYNSVG